MIWYRSFLCGIIILGFLFLGSCAHPALNVDRQDLRQSGSIPLSQSSASSGCVAVELEGSEKEKALQQAFADPQVQWLIAKLNKKEHHADSTAAQAFRVGEASLQVVIPFRPNARLVWGRSEIGEMFAKAVINQHNKWEVFEPYQDPMRFRSVDEKEHKKKVLKELHKNRELQEIKKEREEQGYKIDEEKTQIILNETREEFFIWLRWRANGTGPASLIRPLAYDDGYSTGGGGTDIAVIYDPATGQLTLLIVPPDLVSFIECLGDCLLDLGMAIGPAELAFIVGLCGANCALCRSAPALLNPACWGCGVCVAAVVAAGAFCAWRCW